MRFISIVQTGQTILIHHSLRDTYYLVELPTKFHSLGFETLDARQIIYDKVMAKDFKIFWYYDHPAPDDKDELQLEFTIINECGKKSTKFLDCPQWFPYVNINMEDNTLTIEDYKKCVKSLKHQVAYLEAKHK